mmetsp:Transcript_9061/g.19211  ORF Transcript_9061/g.19211 Transcript_9061/m.19211 type:complete len:80 (+) Transcript_9061:907-1146(+)
MTGETRPNGREFEEGATTNAHGGDGVAAAPERVEKAAVDADEERTSAIEATEASRGVLIIADDFNAGRNRRNRSVGRRG